MAEASKKTSITKDTLKQLYVHSGNQCAFPECTATLFNRDGDFVGRISHIEGVGRKGERQLPDMSNEATSAPENLLLLCHSHHLITNDMVSYPVGVMKLIKAEHERKFGDLESIAQKMARTIQDAPPPPSRLRRPQNLGRLLANFEADFHVGEDHEMVFVFNEALEDFSRLSPAAKKLFAIALDRSRDASDTRGVPLDSTYFVPDEVREAAGIIPYELKQLLREIEQAGLIAGFNTGRETLYEFLEGQLDWGYWAVFRKYCHANSISIIQVMKTEDFTFLDD